MGLDIMTTFQLPTEYSRCPICQVAFGPRDEVRWCRLSRCPSTTQRRPTAQDVADFKIGFQEQEE